MSASRIANRRMNLMSVIVFIPCLLLVTGNSVFAEPYLQLDASDSFAPTLTLYALVNSLALGADLTDTFYISAAIVPSMPEDPDPLNPTNLGSFDFAGTTINVVKDMHYGSPPLNTILNPDQLAVHNIFDTYFDEFSFDLSTALTAEMYNTMDNPGGPTYGPGPLYVQAFDVDVSGLDPDHAVHFDLYTRDPDPDGPLDRFAPFSHDVTTPEPASFILGSIGIGMVIARCRKRKTLIES